MSMICCKLCGFLADSDDDTDGFYTKKYPDDFVCENCRETENLPTIFQEE